MIVMPSAASSAPAGPLSALAEPLPCQRVPSDLWFSELPAELEQAKAHCQQCPLRTACLAGALERAEPCGVWGGEIFHQGAVIARKRPRGRPPKVRSDAGEATAAA
jgi:WhiB family redox-sensing transcriptional regulator